MPAMTTEPPSPTVGVAVLDADVDRLPPPDLPAACPDALEEHGVLLFRQLHATDEQQAASARRLGTLAWNFGSMTTRSTRPVSFTATFVTPGCLWIRSRVTSWSWAMTTLPRVLAEVLDRKSTDELRLLLLPGRPDSHPEFQTRRLPTAV